MKKILVLIFVFGLSVPALGFAYYTPENFALDGIHSPPSSFSLDGLGGFYGLTVDGKAFTQNPVINSFSVRLHKFTINEAYFYISDKGAFKAESDLKALSIYYALV